MRIIPSLNKVFFPGAIVEWQPGIKEMALEIHPSAARMLDGATEPVEFDGEEAEQFYINSNQELCYG